MVSTTPPDKRPPDKESRDRHGVTYRRGEQSGRVRASRSRPEEEREGGSWGQGGRAGRGDPRINQAVWLSNGRRCLGHADTGWCGGGIHRPEWGRQDDHLADAAWPGPTKWR